MVKACLMVKTRKYMPRGELQPIEARSSALGRESLTLIPRSKTPNCITQAMSLINGHMILTEISPEEQRSDPNIREGDPKAACAINSLYISPGLVQHQTWDKTSGKVVK